MRSKKREKKVGFLGASLSSYSSLPSSMPDRMRGGGSFANESLLFMADIVPARVLTRLKYWLSSSASLSPVCIYLWMRKLILLFIAFLIHLKS